MGKHRWQLFFTHERLRKAKASQNHLTNSDLTCCDLLHLLRVLSILERRNLAELKRELNGEFIFVQGVALSAKA